MKRFSSFVFPKQQENDVLESTQPGQTRNGNFKTQGSRILSRASPNWNAVHEGLNQFSSIADDCKAKSTYDAFSRCQLQREQQKPNLTAFTKNSSSKSLLRKTQERPGHKVSMDKPVQMENKQLRPGPYWASMQDGINRAAVEESSIQNEHDLYTHNMVNISQADPFSMISEPGQGRPAPHWSAIEQHVNTTFDQSDFPGEEDPFRGTEMITADQPEMEPEEEVAPYLSRVEQKMASSIEGSNFPKSLLSAYWVNTDEQSQKSKNVYVKKSESKSNVKPAEISASDKKFSQMSKAKKRDLFEKAVLGQMPSAKGEIMKPSSEEQEPSAKPFLQTGPSEDFKKEMSKLSSLSKRDQFGKPVLGKDPLLNLKSGAATPSPPASKSGTSAKNSKDKDTADGAIIKVWKPSPPKTEAEKLSTSIKGDPFVKPVLGKHKMDPTNEGTNPPSWRISDSFTKPVAKDVSSEMPLKKREPSVKQVLGQSDAVDYIIEVLEPQANVSSSGEPKKDKSNKKGIAKLKNKIEAYEKELQRVKEQLEDATFEKEEYLKCITQLNDQAQKDRQLMDHLGYDNASLKRLVKEKEKDLGLLVKADEKLQSQASTLEDAQCENQKLSLDMARLKGVLEEFKNKNATAVSKIKMLTDLEAQTAMKNESLMLTERMLVASVQEFEEDIKGLKAENESVLKEVQTLNTTKKKEEEIRAENVLLKTRIDELEFHIKKKEENELKPHQSIMEALKKTEEPKRRIYEINKEKAKIKSENNKYIDRMEKLVEIEKKPKFESSSGDMKTEIEELKADLEFVKQESLLETSTNVQPALKVDVDFQVRNEELKYKVKELEEKLRQSKSTDKKSESEKKVSYGAKTAENPSKDMISIDEVMKKLKKLNNFILDAKKKLNDDKDGSSIKKSTSSSLSDKLFEAKKCQKLDKTLKQDERSELEGLYTTLTNTAEELIDEIIKKSKRVGKPHGDDMEGDEISTLKDNVMHLEDDLTDVKDKCKDLQRHLNEKDQLIKELEKEFEDIKNKLNTSVTASENQLDQLRGELKRKTAKAKELQGKLQTYQNKENEWNEALETVRSEAAAKEIKVTDLKGYIKELKTENLRLLEEIEERRRKNIKVHHSNNDELRNEITKLKKTIKDLEAERNKLKQDLRNVNIKELEAELDDIKREKNMEMMKMVDHITVLQGEIKDRERTLTNARDEASNDKKKYERDTESLRKEIQSLNNATVENKKNLIENDNDLTAEKTTTVNSLEQLNKDMLNKIEMYDALSLQIRNDNEMVLDSNYEITSSLGVQIENTIRFLESSNDELRNKLSNSEHQLKKMMENRDVPDNTKTEKENVTEEQDKHIQQSKDDYKLNEEIEKQKSLCKKLEETLETMTAELKNIQVERSALKKELTDLKLNHLPLMTEMKHAVTMKTSLKEPKVMIKDEVESLEKELPGREAELDILKKARESHPTVNFKNDIESFETKLKDLTKDNEMMISNEKKLQLYDKQRESDVVLSRSTFNELNLKITKLEVAKKRWKEKENNFKNEIQTSAAKIEHLESKLSESMKSLQSFQDQGKLVTVVQETDTRKMATSKLDELAKQHTDVQSKLKVKEDLIQDLEQQILSLTTERSNSLKQLKQKSIQVEKLESTLNDKHGMEKMLSDKVQVLEKSNVEMKEQFEKFKAGKFLYTKQLETMDTQPDNEATDSLVNIVELQRMVGEVLNEKAIMYEQERQLKENIEKLEKINSSLTSEKESLENQLTKLKEESERRLKSLEDQFLKSKEASEKSLQSSKYQLKKALEVSKNALKSLEEQIYKKNDELIKSKEASEKTIHSLEEQLIMDNEASKKALKSLKEQLCEKNDEFKYQKHTLSEQIQELENQAKIYEGQLDLLRRKVSRLETDKTQWEQKNIRLQREGFSMLEKINDLQNKLVNKTINVKTDEINNSSIEVTASLKAVMDDKERILEQVQLLNTKITNLESDAASSCGKINDLERKLSKLQDSKVMWEQKEVRLEKEALTLGKNIDSLQEKLDEQKMQLTEKEVQHVVTKETIAQLQESMRKIAAVKEFLESQCADIKSLMQSRIKQLEQTVSELVASKKVLWENQTEMQMTIDKEKRNVQSLTLENEQLTLKEKSLNKHTTSKVVETSEKYTNTENEWKNPEKELKEKQCDLQECVSIATNEKNALMTQYEKKTAELENKIKDLKTRTSEEKKAKDLWTQAESHLKEKIHELEETIVTLSAKNEQLDTQHNKQTEKYIEQSQTTKQGISELENKTLLLQGQVESLTFTNNKLKMLEREDEAGKPQNSSDDSMVESKIKLLQDQVESLTSCNSKLKEKIKQQPDTYENKAQELEDKMPQPHNISDTPELASRIKPLQAQVESLTSNSRKLKEVMKHQQEAYEKKVIDQKDRFGEPRSAKQDVSELEKKISLLQERVDSLMSDNYNMNLKIKEQQEAYEKKMVKEDNKIGETQSANQDVLELEKKIALFQERVVSLMSDNDKLNLKIKEQREAYEKMMEKDDKVGEPHSAKQYVHKLENKISLLQERVNSLVSDNNNLNLKIKEQQEAYEKVMEEQNKVRESQSTKQGVSELEKRIALFQELVDSLVSDNNQLNLKIKEQRESFKKKNGEPQSAKQDVSELEKKIALLQERVNYLTFDNEKLNQKIKQQHDAFKLKALRLEDKVGQPENASIVAESEVKVTFLQGRIESLTSDKAKLNAKLKKQHKAHKKKVCDLEEKISNQKSNSVRPHVLKKKDDSSSQQSETTTSYKDELLELKEHLQESKDSEKKLSNLLEHMKSKLSELNDVNDKLQKENDYLFNKVRDHKNDMKRYIELDQDIQDKIVNLTDEILTTKSEKRQLYQEINSLIKELQAKNDEGKQLSLGDEITLALRTSIESIEDDEDSFWGINVKNIPEEDKDLHNLELVEDDTPLPNLRSSLQKLKSVIDTALQTTHDENQKTQDKQSRAKRKIAELEEKITRFEEENDFLQRQVQELNAHLQQIKTEAKGRHELSLVKENESETMVASLKEKLTQVQEEKHSVQMQVKELISSKDKLESSIQEKLAEVRQWKHRVTSLELKSAEYSETMEQNEVVYNDSIIKLNEKIHKLEKDLKAKESITMELNDEVYRLEIDLRMKQQCVTQQLKTKKDLEEQVKNAQEKISLLEESTLKAEHVLDEMKLDKESVEKVLKGKLENEKQEKNGMFTSKEELQKTVDRLREQLEKPDRERKEMFGEEKAKSKEVEEKLGIVMCELRESPDENANELKASILRLSEELELKTKVNKELNDNLINLQAIIHHLEEKNYPCTEESNCLTVTIKPKSRQANLNLNELKLKQNTLRKNIEELRRDVDRLGDPQKDVDDETKDQIRLLKYQVSAALEKIHDLHRHIKYRAQKERNFIEEIAVVKTDRDNLAKKVCCSELKISQLWMEITASKTQVCDLQQELNERNSEIMCMYKQMVFSSMRDD